MSGAKTPNKLEATMEEHSFECVVSADLFRRALLAVSTEETRYYLNGVHVSPAPDGGAVLVATNGSFLIALHDPDALVSGEGIVMLSKPMKAALKQSGILLEKRLLLVRQAPSKHRAFVADIPTKGEPTDGEYSPYEAARSLFDDPDARVRAAQFGAVTIDGTFPDWRRIVPDLLAPGVPVPPLDQALVSKVADALSMDKTMRRVRMTATGPTPANSPVLVTSDEPSSINAFAIVMPVRSHDAAATVPVWARRSVPAAA